MMCYTSSKFLEEPLLAKSKEIILEKRSFFALI